MSSRDEIPLGYVSVTEILRPYTKLDKIDPVVLANAADRGTRVHKWCTMYAMNMLFGEVDEDCKGYVEAFKRWCDEYLDTIIMEPKRINSEQYRLSGEFDLFIKMKRCSGNILIDIKTPSTISPTWQLQTAGYQILLEKQECVEIDQRMILQLPRYSGEAKVIVHDQNCKNDKDLFFSALNLYRYFNP